MCKHKPLIFAAGQFRLCKPNYFLLNLSNTPKPENNTNHKFFIVFFSDFVLGIFNESRTSLVLIEETSYKDALFMFTWFIEFPLQRDKGYK